MNRSEKMYATHRIKLYPTGFRAKDEKSKRLLLS